MALYKAIFDKVPGPNQVGESVTDETAVAEVRETTTVPYLVGLLLFCIVVVGLILKKQSLI